MAIVWADRAERLVALAEGSVLVTKATDEADLQVIVNPQQLGGGPGSEGIQEAMIPGTAATMKEVMVMDVDRFVLGGDVLAGDGATGTMRMRMIAGQCSAV